MQEWIHKSYIQKKLKKDSDADNSSDSSFEGSPYLSLSEEKSADSNYSSDKNLAPDSQPRCSCFVCMFNTLKKMMDNPQPQQSLHFVNFFENQKAAGMPDAPNYGYISSRIYLEKYSYDT